MSSMQAVAARAGVSYTTVSRVINGKADPASATARKVYRAMREIGYRPPPSEHRRGPRPRRAQAETGSVGALLFGLTARILETLPGGATIHAAESRLAEAGLSLVLSSCTDMNRVPTLVSHPGVVGFLLFSTGAYPTPQVIERIAARPSVWMFTHAVGWGDQVRPNNERIARLAAEYFLGHGGGPVAFLNLLPDVAACRHRGFHFQDAMRQLGAEAVLLSDEGPPVDDDARADRLVARLRALSPMPRGVFVATDYQLPFVYAALRRQGIEPGRDVRILGCDNNTAALRLVSPRPDTIDIGCADMGRRAVDQILWRAKHPEESDGWTIMVPPRLALSGDAPADGPSLRTGRWLA